MTKRSDILYNKVKQKGITLNHVAEIGVFMPETSNICRFVLDGIKSTFVEPDPKSIEAISKYFDNRENITLHPVAVFDQVGKVELVQRAASTYLKVLNASPAIVNDEYKIDEKNTFEVDAVTFDTIDDGKIDLISIDIEGGEWFVLKHMLSRPLVLSIETHGGIYVNPYMSEIDRWMSDNRYSVWYLDASDTVYVKDNTFSVSAFEKLHTTLMLLRIQYSRYRKLAKRAIERAFSTGTPICSSCRRTLYSCCSRLLPWRR